MPRRSPTTKAARTEKLEVAPPKRPVLHMINDALSVIFHLIWIVIGIFLVVLIIQGQRRGAFDGLLSGANTAPQGAGQSAPTETDLPGIGRVNISCVQKALSPQSLQKFIQGYDTSVLTPDEKTNFEKCIVSKETSSPSGTPAASASTTPTQ